MKTESKNTPSSNTIPSLSVCHAGVRFDRERGQWGILDPKLKTIRTFERGIIIDAQMEAKQVRKGVGCGAHTDVIGVAYGEVHEGTYNPSSRRVATTGYKNLEFKDGVFVNGDGERIETASVIRLMPERKALYRP